MQRFPRQDVQAEIALPPARSAAPRPPVAEYPRLSGCALAGLALVLITAAAAHAQPPAGPPAAPGWTKHVINDRAPFEGAGVADLDGDGKLDVFSGDSWYRAPDWKRFKVRQVGQIHPQYHEDFASLPLDVNGDGLIDFVTCTYFGKRLGWVENPGDLRKHPGKPWIEHDIDYPGPSEACALVDINGDGKPDLLPATNNQIVWYELSAQAPCAVWKRHLVSSRGAGHGVGYGDVNGDGRLDLIGPRGWYEQPSRDGEDEWPFHPEFDLGGASILIVGRDVDGDGLTDVIAGVAHGRGLYWLRQARDAAGKRTWHRQDIDPELHEAHTTRLADLDGDGGLVLVTGTRVYGHEVEPGDTDAPMIAAYRFDRAARAWRREVIYLGEPARGAPKEAKERHALRDFPRGTAGTGLQLEARDLDGDGDLDLVTPGKSGLYWFENPRLRARPAPP